LNKWLLLVHKTPREPTARRVFVWRKLKQLGAVMLQDSVWALPAGRHPQEQLQWLAAEIVEIGGEATIFAAHTLAENDAAKLVRQFLDAIEADYNEILLALKRRDRDLGALSRKYQLIRSRDYFDSKLGERVRRDLLTAGGEEN
jgi:DNA-binding transcriptional regulator PaaX